LITAIRKFLFKNITIPLFRLYVRLEFKEYRKALKLSTYAYQILHLRVRNLLKLKIRGYDEDKDDSVFLAICKLLELKISEQDQETLKIKEKKINKVCNKIQNDELSLQLIDIYTKLKNLFNEKHNIELVLNNRPLPNSVLIKNIDIHELKNVSKVLKRKAKPEYDELIDRSSFKLDFSLSEIGNIFAILTPIIFVGGYYYSKIYFNHFGFNIHNFFSISDYITVSIDKLELALFGGLIAIISTFSTIFRYSKSSYKLTNNSEKSKKWIMQLFFIILLVSAVCLQFYFNGKNKFFTLHFLLTIVFLLLGDYLAVNYFRNPLKPLFIITFILQFYLNISISVFSEINDIENNGVKETSTITFNSDIDIKNKEELVIIGFSNDYIYLRDSINNKSITVKKKNILYLTKP
jgi:hypothetical protein